MSVSLPYTFVIFPLEKIGREIDVDKSVNKKEVATAAGFVRQSPKLYSN
jgi:hypothetical protein